jgi:hypothetical protein
MKLYYHANVSASSLIISCMLHYFITLVGCGLLILFLRSNDSKPGATTNLIQILYFQIKSMRVHNLVYVVEL